MYLLTPHTASTPPLPQFQHYEVRISSNYCNVGDLLRVFCDSLEDQILHRKYFYKSATMVHEGMILVHNSGLTGDPTMASVRLHGYCVATVYRVCTCTCMCACVLGCMAAVF